MKKKKNKKFPKSHWNFRILAFKDVTGEVFFQVYEVYYKDNIPNGYGREAVLFSDTKKGLKWYNKMHKKALKKPILWGDENFPKKYKKKK